MRDNEFIKIGIGILALYAQIAPQGVLIGLVELENI